MEQYQTDGQRVGLNAWQLKLIAIVAMVIDHLAFSFVPDGTFLAVAMHFIGRITGPTMFYFAVEGYHHTRDLTRYILRLVIFAGISYFPFLLFHAGGDVGSLNPLRLNVIYTILLGVLAVTVRHHVKNSVLKLLLILLLFTLGMLGDWAIYGIIIILVFDFYRGDFRNQAVGYALITLLGVGVLRIWTSPFQSLIYLGEFSLNLETFLYYLSDSGMFLALFLLSRYNGERGPSGGWRRWLFYWFYPAHLLLIGGIQFLMLRTG